MRLVHMAAIHHTVRLPCFVDRFVYRGAQNDL